MYINKLKYMLLNVFFHKYTEWYSWLDGMMMLLLILLMMLLLMLLLLLLLLMLLLLLLLRLMSWSKRNLSVILRKLKPGRRADNSHFREPSRFPCYNCGSLMIQRSCDQRSKSFERVSLVSIVQFRLVSGMVQEYDHKLHSCTVVHFIECVGPRVC